MAKGNLKRTVVNGIDGVQIPAGATADIPPHLQDKLWTLKFNH